MKGRHDEPVSLAILAALPDEILLNVKNFGKKSLADLRRALAERAMPTLWLQREGMGL
jgi:DNA-directed RNA polymerase alpha subunit